MFRYFVLSYIAVASANVALDGECPKLKPVDNFNLTAYLGTWYEYSKLPCNDDKNMKCWSVDLKQDGDVVKIKKTYVIDGVQNIVDEDTAKQPADAGKTGLLELVKNSNTNATKTPMMILATDYANYAVAFKCEYDETKKTHQVHTWVLTRTKKLEGEAKTAVDNYLKANTKELDASKLVETDFSDEACKFNSTNVVTEAPKA